MAGIWARAEAQPIQSVLPPPHRLQQAAGEAGCASAAEARVVVGYAGRAHGQTNSRSVCPDGRGGWAPSSSRFATASGGAATRSAPAPGLVSEQRFVSIAKSEAVSLGASGRGGAGDRGGRTGKGGAGGRSASGVAAAAAAVKRPVSLLNTDSPSSVSLHVVVCVHFPVILTVKSPKDFLGIVFLCYVIVVRVCRRPGSLGFRRAKSIQLDPGPADGLESQGAVFALGTAQQRGRRLGGSG